MPVKILDFGSANIDIVYAMDAIVKPGETAQSKGISVFPGGKGLNQAVALARAGAECYFAGTIGADGLFLRDLLNSAGVNTSLLKLSDNKTGHAIIQVDKEGRNSIIIASGANGENSTEYIDSVLSNFAKGDYLVLQNEINNLPYIIQRAHEMGMVIFLNSAPMNETILSLDFSQIDYLILNETEAEQISKTSDTNQFFSFMRNKYPNLHIVLTLGENGSIYAYGDEMHHCLAYQVDAVDTTAAGDTYTGYFIASLSMNYSIKEALDRASIAAAISVSRPGAAVSIPMAEEIGPARQKLKSINRLESEVRRRLRLYLQENIKTASLQEFSAQINYSCDYTGKLITKLTGKSFATLLQDVRCEEAAKLLTSTDLSVSQIALAVGYNNESFFRRIFSERYGKTPKDYRKSKNAIT